MSDTKYDLKSASTTADSPELDRSGEAPEKDIAANAPEHIQHSSTDLPIPVLPTEIGEKEKYPKLVDPSEKELQRQAEISHSWRLRRKVWILICLSILVIGIAIGVGAGVGISSRSQTPPSPPVASTTPIVAPSNDDAFLLHGILNDSSVASIVTSEGNKHFMFQDSAGLLRDAFYSAATQTWTSTDHFVIPGNARNNSPLTAVIYENGPENGPDPSPDQVVLFYVDTNNKINHTIYSHGSWHTDGIFLFDLTNITLIDNPRTLSIAKVTNPFSRTAPREEGYSLCLLVLIDAPDQRFRALYGNSTLIRNGTTFENSYWGGPWSWKDESARLEEYLGAPLLAPFAAVSSTLPVIGPSGGILSNSSYMNIIAFADNKEVTGIKIGLFAYLTISNGKGLDINGPAETVMHDLHNVTDIAIPQIYPGGREPPVDMITARTSAKPTWYSIDMEPPRLNPESPFPYSKLTSAVRIKGTAFSMYHQINATTFVEDMWDTEAQIWKSTYVSVTTW